MTNPQGTQWESELRDAARTLHLPADRYPKRGQKGEPDVYIGYPGADNVVPIVSWKRLTKSTPSAKKRTPDGVRDVVVMRTEDFLMLANRIWMDPRPNIKFEVQSKWTQNLNVTRTLGDLIKWLEEHREDSDS